MRDHVIEELISAYVDGELAGDELKLVERKLAESAEHRQLLAELQALRASIQALPRLKLRADFHTRVVGQIDPLVVSPSKEPARRLGRASVALPWRSVLLAAASLAAMVAVTVMLHPPALAPGNQRWQGIGPLRAVPVYLREFRQAPKYVMVYDVTITPAGQKNNALEALLRKLGIGLDPALRLDGQLEDQLMVIRESQQVPSATEATPYKTDQATPKSNANDKVAMIYVAGTLGVLDQFGTSLKQMSLSGEEVSQLHYAMAIEPNKLGVMHRLHDSAREHFARGSNILSSEVGLAFQITFRVELTSVSVPGAAMFPIPMVQTQSTEADPDREPSSIDENGEARRPDADARDPGHILLIIRNVDANAAAGK